MENSDLLQALLQVPPNLTFAREQLLSGRYSPQQVTELGYHYAEECWNEDLDADNGEFYSEEFDYYWREANTIADRHSFYLYEVIDLLLKHKSYLKLRTLFDGALAEKLDHQQVMYNKLRKLKRAKKKT